MKITIIPGINTRIISTNSGPPSLELLLRPSGTSKTSSVWRSNLLRAFAKGGTSIQPGQPRNFHQCSALMTHRKQINSQQIDDDLFNMMIQWLWTWWFNDDSMMKNKRIVCECLGLPNSETNPTDLGTSATWANMINTQVEIYRVAESHITWEIYEKKHSFNCLESQRVQMIKVLVLVFETKNNE